ncbi:MAG: LysR family transcriptional regulator [Thermoleophilaceae bacterium]|nr:LysR family transcriptional regulator [Thermoleophilaceae bacterium]
MIGTGMLDVRRLVMLLEVARTGSFAAAAESMSFTPSAVSQQMCALERATKVVLFSRGARGVTLTAAGRSLHLHAEAVTRRLAEAEAELEVIGGVSDARLRFGSFTSATGAFAAEAYRIFRDRYPEAEVCFSDGEPYENLALLSENRLELAVIFELDDWPSTMDYRGINTCRETEFECVPLFDDPYLLVLPADHPLAVEETVALAQLTGERVLASTPWERTLRRICAEADVEPALDLSCQGTGFEALQALVSIGHGVSFMPALSLGWLREGLVARPVERAPMRHVKIAVRTAACRSSASQAMLEILTRLTEGLGLNPAVEGQDPDLEPALAS